ncbi:MAG: CopD family protein [Deltaproteobacteria bacterium]|nr:CopD family protein [Deltaproteobacteria bacterium]
MPALYLLSVWIHILAAMAWIGGMFFLVLVVVPWLRAGNRANAGAFLRETGQRFRSVGWSCFAILTVTGTFNLYVRGVRLGDFTRPEWLASPFGRSVLYKLGLFALVLVVSAVHDFSVGPRASVAIQRDPGSPEAERLRRQASLMGRGNVLLALALVAVAVTLVRGSPW